MKMDNDGRKLGWFDGVHVRSDVELSLSRPEDVVPLVNQTRFTQQYQLQFGSNFVFSTTTIRIASRVSNYSKWWDL